MRFNIIKSLYGHPALSKGLFRKGWVETPVREKLCSKSFSAPIYEKHSDIKPG